MVGIGQAQAFSNVGERADSTCRGIGHQKGVGCCILAAGAQSADADESGGFGELAGRTCPGRYRNGGGAWMLVGQDGYTTIDRGIYLDVGDIVGRAAGSVFDDQRKAGQGLDVDPVQKSGQRVIYGCSCYQAFYKFHN